MGGFGIGWGDVVYCYFKGTLWLCLLRTLWSAVWLDLVSVAYSLLLIAPKLNKDLLHEAAYKLVIAPVIQVHRKHNMVSEVKESLA